MALSYLRQLVVSRNTINRCSDALEGLMLYGRIGWCCDWFCTHPHCLTPLAPSITPNNRPCRYSLESLFLDSNKLMSFPEFIPLCQRLTLLNIRGNKARVCVCVCVCAKVG